MIHCAPGITLSMIKYATIYTTREIGHIIDIDDDINKTGDVIVLKNDVIQNRYTAKTWYL